MDDQASTADRPARGSGRVEDAPTSKEGAASVVAPGVTIEVSNGPNDLHDGVERSMKPIAPSRCATADPAGGGGSAHRAATSESKCKEYVEYQEQVSRRDGQIGSLQHRLATITGRIEDLERIQIRGQGKMPIAGGQANRGDGGGGDATHEISSESAGPTRNP